MTISLHHALVPQWIQLLGSVEGLLDKAAAWCEHEKKDPETVLGAKLAPDMFDFVYQVKSTWVHSIGAVEGVRAGTFSPDMSKPERSFSSLKARTREVIEQLRALDEAEFEGFTGNDMEFRFGEYRKPFDADEFLLSLSLPNFFFHVTAAYAILRNLGVDVGKMDYMGAMRGR